MHTQSNYSLSSPDLWLVQMFEFCTMLTRDKAVIHLPSDWIPTMILSLAGISGSDVSRPLNLDSPFGATYGAILQAAFI